MTLAYGTDWSSIRKEIIQRDSEMCINCGKTRQEQRDEFQVDLHVHHLIPLRQWKTASLANRSKNLVTLCTPCHGEWEEKCLDEVLDVYSDILDFEPITPAPDELISSRPSLRVLHPSAWTSQSPLVPLIKRMMRIRTKTCSIETAKGWVATHNEGRAEELLEDMLTDRDSPIEGYGGRGRKISASRLSRTALSGSTTTAETCPSASIIEHVEPETPIFRFECFSVNLLENRRPLFIALSTTNRARRIGTINRVNRMDSPAVNRQDHHDTNNRADQLPEACHPQRQRAGRK